MVPKQLETLMSLGEHFHNTQNLGTPLQRLKSLPLHRRDKLKTCTANSPFLTLQIAATLILLGFCPALIAATLGTVTDSSIVGAPDDVGPDHRSWHLSSLDALGKPSRAPIVELETGMNYWDGKSWSA